jgi:hypothetical protein
MSVTDGQFLSLKPNKKHATLYTIKTKLQI